MHPDFPMEAEHMALLRQKIDQTLAATLASKQVMDEELAELAKHYDPDSQQDYIDMLTGTLLSGSADRQIRNLREAQDVPYFARIDFEEKAGGCERLYIGKLSLIDEKSQKIHIVDWRAPVSNLYYEGRLGEAGYDSPSGRIEGLLKLKRQFSAREGKLLSLTDVDITTEDDLLKAFTHATTDDRLKEIVSTIQEEQNRIIRADMWRPLVVQGAAGSGKTTIALHRIAYLTYNHPELKADAFMVIAPNRFFLNYISDVLPDLGVENIVQTTFEDYAMGILGKTLKVSDPHGKLAALCAGQQGYEEALELSRYKCSMDFRKVLDRYIALVEEDFLPREDLTVEDVVIYPYGEIRRLFLEEYRNLPIARRVDEIKKHMVGRLNRVVDAAVAKLHEDCDRFILFTKLKEKEETPQRQQKIVFAIEEKNRKIAALQKGSKQAIQAYIKRISRVSPMEYYGRLMNDPVLLSSLGESAEEGELLTRLAVDSAPRLNMQRYETEDLAPMIWLKYRIHGIDEKSPVRQIIVDEAQDLSVFQLYVLKKIIAHASFTVLGDLCQGIQSYKGVQDWQDVVTQVFDGGCDFLTLERSYRSTVEIIREANKVIHALQDPRLITGSPILRHGDVPKRVALSGDKAAAHIARSIRAARQEGLRSMAVICPTPAACKAMQKRLGKLGEVTQLITGKEHVYGGGTVIIPVHLVKGLEFDCVFITDAEADIYTHEPVKAKLLYVAMTRALHRLTLYGQNFSPLTGDIPAENA